MAPAIRYYFNQNSGVVIYAYILPAYLEQFQNELCRASQSNTQ